MRVLIFLILFSNSVWAAAPDCEQFIGATYSAAIAELAKGYISLEKMNTDGGGSRGAKVSFKKELDRQMQELVKTVGAVEFERLFKKEIRRQSGQTVTEDHSRREVRAQAIENEVLFNSWMQNFKFPNTGSRYSQLVFSGNSERLMLLHNSLDVQIWNPETKKIITALKPFDRRVTSIDISFDGKLAATGGADGSVRIWNAETGEELHAYLDKFSDQRFTTVKFSPNGEFLVATSVESPKVLVWSTKTGALLKQIDTYDSISALKFSPKGHLLIASVSHSKRIKTEVAVWNLEEMYKSHRIEFKWSIEQAIFVGGGNFIMTTERLSSGQKVWDLTVPNKNLMARLLRRPFSPKSTEIFKASDLEPKAFTSGDGKIILTSGSSEFISTWSGDTRQHILNLDNGSGERVFQASFGLNNEVVAVGTSNGTTKLFSTVTGAFYQMLETETEAPKFQFSPNGRYFVTSESDGNVILWQQSMPEDTE